MHIEEFVGPVCARARLNAQRNIQKDVLQANYTFFEEVKIQAFLSLCTGLDFPPWYVSSHNQSENKKANFTMEGRSWAGVSLREAAKKEGIGRDPQIYSPSIIADIH